MNFTAPLGVSGYWHFVQEIKEGVCVWLFLVLKQGFARGSVTRVIFLHSVQENARGSNL